VKVDTTVRRPEPAASMTPVVACCTTITAVRVFGHSLRGIVQGDTSVYISRLVDLFEQGGS
jgi:hypothetical protein